MKYNSVMKSNVHAAVMLTLSSCYTSSSVLNINKQVNPANTFILLRSVLYDFYISPDLTRKRTA